MKNKVINIIKKYPLYTVLSVSAVVIIIIALVIMLIPHNNAYLSISVAPVDATIEINNQQYENGVFRGMPPGHYSAVISKPDFETKTVEFELRNDEVFYLNEYLMQSNQEFDYYETDLSSLLVLREYSEAHEDAKVKEFLEKYDKKMSIIDILPLEHEQELTGDYYKVDYMEKNYNCGRNYCITIESNNDLYAELALTIMRNNGYNPEDYEIIYISDGCD